MKKVAVALSLLAMSLSLTPGHARSPSKEYVGSTDPINVRALCDHSSTVGTNVGVVCFAVQSDERTLDVTGADAVNAEGAYFWYLADEDGECAGTLDPTVGACSSAGFACPTATGIPIPSRARSLEVYPLATLAPTVCALEGVTSPGVTTTGVITATFR
jgi:hypothetical protein